MGLGLGLVVPGTLLGCDGSSAPLDAGTRRDAARRDAGPPPVPRGITKGPYVQLLGAGAARVRFETRFDEPTPLVVERASGTTTPTLTRLPQTLSYARDLFGDPQYRPDQPGLHVVHEAVLEGLEPGEEVRWTAMPNEGEPVSGTFRAAVDASTGFRLGWISDTSFPVAEMGIGTLASKLPDLVIHGGDITYQANPFDTWNTMAHGMGPLFARAPVHFCVGNHEFEDQDEISVQYDRLFAGQGDAGGSPRYFAFTYGAVRFLCIDTESGELASMDEPQLAWLDAELAAVDADPSLRFAIAAFHRPTYTLSRHAPRDTVVRELLHQRFVAHGVPLVLAGHVHAYERFAVDGIQYVIDGGGGAILYDPDQRRDEVEMLRPGESALRQHAERGLGVTTVDVAADGILTVRRWGAEDGAMQDEVVIGS
jgi:predicted phosphodiesterase